MQALNVEAEYRRSKETPGVEFYSLDHFLRSKVESGEWIEDDGDYYLPEVWATQHDEGDNYTGPTYPEYDD